MLRDQCALKKGLWPQTMKKFATEVLQIQEKSGLKVISHFKSWCISTFATRCFGSFLLVAVEVSGWLVVSCLY